MIRTTMLGLLLALMVAPLAWSGQISPYLEDRLNGMTASDDVGILVMMQEQADIKTLNAELKTSRATLAERNHAVIEALQETASRTQPMIALQKAAAPRKRSMKIAATSPKTSKT